MAHKKLYPVSEKDIKILKGESDDSEKKIKDNAKKLYPVSEKDIKILKESGTNSYAKDNQTTIKKLKN
jgi:hypothetical protein